MSVDIRFLPDDKTVRVKPGMTVLDASRKARVHIRTRCGGNASCLMCKVTVEDDGAGLSAPGDNEVRKLGSMIDERVRLACQARAIGSCVVSVPEDPLKAAVRAQLAKQREDDWL
ncbi:2Fe-2S iron-sulfur cluster-binding protein [Paenibacillus flagellatus]|uniref:Ferredoxin n=1 Tax=Paenibacillus flagellatus TaxID=2211139 RepID=A0A2V5K7Y1_9BACL|nr:2Fe-2S iron-sulfur cluster-binding protein [Paenibacillus flagellatus]PYI54942.1 ferredoxin [Paenibacillus flagellatus]